MPKCGQWGWLMVGLGIAPLLLLLPVGMMRGPVPEWSIILSLVGFLVAGVLAGKEKGNRRARFKSGLFRGFLLIFPLMISLVILPSLTTWCPPLPTGMRINFLWAPLPGILLGAVLGAVGKGGVKRACKRLWTFVLWTGLFSGAQVLLGPRMAPYHPVTGKLSFHFSSGEGGEGTEAILFAWGVLIWAALRIWREDLSGAKKRRVARGQAFAVLAWMLLGDPFGGGVGILFRASRETVAVWPANQPEIVVTTAKGWSLRHPEKVGDVQRLAMVAATLAREHREKLGLGVERPLTLHLLLEEGEQLFWTGVNRVDFVKPWQGTIHMSSLRPSIPHLSHEMVHAILASKGPWPFRVPWSTTIVEGAAVALAEFTDTDEGQWAHVAFAKRAQEAPTEVLGGLAFWTGNFRTSYKRSGGLMGYLLQSRGKEAFLALYANADWEEAFGKPPEDALSEWGLYLEGLDVPQRARRDSERLYAAQPRFREACLVRWQTAINSESPWEKYISMVRNEDPKLNRPGGRYFELLVSSIALGGFWKTDSLVDWEEAWEWLNRSPFQPSEITGSALTASRQRAHDDLTVARTIWHLGWDSAPDDAWKGAALSSRSYWDPDQEVNLLEQLGPFEPGLSPSRRLSISWLPQWRQVFPERLWSTSTSLLPESESCPLLLGVEDGGEAWDLWMVLVCGSPLAPPEIVSLAGELEPWALRWMGTKVLGWAESTYASNPQQTVDRLLTLERLDNSWVGSPRLGRIRRLANTFLEGAK